MDIVTILVLLAVSVVLVLYSILPGARAARDTVKRRLEGKRAAADSRETPKEQRGAAARSLAKRAAPMLSKIIMPTSEDEVSQLRVKLISAGYRASGAQTVYLGMKTAMLVVGAIAGIAGGMAMGYSMVGISACASFAGGLGFVAPGMWLSAAIKSRQDRVRRGLPDVLDLLVVSVESGLALDAAIKRVGEEMALVHPELSDEFRIATMEAQMGIPRMETLSNMAERVALDELRSVISVISQAERFGTSVATALRNQGDSMRSKRRLEAEERAQKTAVKLMMPLVLFIFPAMGIVLAGPAALNLIEAFGN
jgi:tight adherence protein C